jgi:tRNA nucleotidyltransferase (CCA-adding enzyme)
MLKIEIPEKVNFIIKRLEEHGYEAYAVGGCVRDSILQRVPGDWDITTSATPYQVKELFRRTIDTGIQHGTVTIMLGEDGYEVTTYRIDGKYEDGRHPKEVIFTPSLEEDLKRRDFTINAMAYNPTTGMVDMFGGQADLENKTIRCVGSPLARFGEDALRMMRAVRFAAQLGFTIEEETFSAIRELTPNLKKVSAERIQVELSKLLKSDNPACFRLLYETGITAVVLPEFDKAMQTEQHSPYHCYSVGEHTMCVLCNTPPNLQLRLAALLHDIAKPEVKTTDENGRDHFYGHPEQGAILAKKILKRLKYDNYTVDRVSRLIRWHDYRLPADKTAVRRAVHKVGEDIFEDLLKLMFADASGKKPELKEKDWEHLQKLENLYHEIQRDGECVSLKTLAVNGRDLMEHGVQSGKNMGQVLNRLLEHVLEKPEDNQKEILLNLLGEISAQIK